MEGNMALPGSGETGFSAVHDHRLRNILFLLMKILRWSSVKLAAEQDRWPLWTPVFIGAGISFYFSLPFEPPIIVAGLLFTGSLLLCIRARRSAIFLPITMSLLCISAGFAAIMIDTRMNGTAMLLRPLTVDLQGSLFRVDGHPGQGGMKLTIEPQSMSGVVPERMPRRLEVTTRIKGGEALAAGDVISLRARLVPPPGPVAPDGFDFARQAFFSGIGGMGFAVTAPVIVTPHDDRSGAGAWLERLRSRITNHVAERIGGDNGVISAAMMTGETAGISAHANDDLRISGLAHVLSISGLHMALFAGSMFWVARMLLALVPPLALNYPIKKWAACLALLAATGYLLISVPAVATQRSYIMAALMFIAIIAGRPAISMRNIAVAAVIVLLLWPDSLIGASFQMSFSAVIALVGVYESWMRRRADRGGSPDQSRLLVLLGFGGIWLLDAALISLIAGAATGAFAAFHFNRMSSYSLVANVLATPLIGMVIMPAALVAFLLMPFGLDGYVLDLMGMGTSGMMWIAHEVAHWPGATVMVRSGPMSALILLALGGLWLMLWREWWRFLGLAPVLAGLLIWGFASKPFVLVGREGEIAAVRGADGRLVLTDARPVYTARTWLRRDGDDREPADAKAGTSIVCDASGCIYSEEGRPTVAFPQELAGLEEDCTRADIIVTDLKLSWSIKRNCQASILIDGFSLMKDGAVSIFNVSEYYHVLTSSSVRGMRPWSMQN